MLAREGQLTYILGKSVETRRCIPLPHSLANRCRYIATVDQIISVRKGLTCMGGGGGPVAPACNIENVRVAW